MLTAWGPAGQSARFCGEDVKYPQQTQRNAQRLGNLLFPHQPHPLSGGVANRLYVTVPLSRLDGGHFYYTGCTAFCQILPPVRLSAYSSLVILLQAAVIWAYW